MTEAVDPDRRQRVLAIAAATVARLERQAVEHAAWRDDPARRESAELAQEWIDETHKRKIGAGW